MSATLNSRFTLTDDPAEIIRRLRETGELDESLLPDAAPPPPPSAGRGSPDPAPGREADGKFAKGNSGGPGNPFARRVAALRARLLNRATEDDMDVITGQLIQHARKGDLAAIKLFYQYTVGKPAPTVDPDRVDIDEVNLLEAARLGTQLANNLGRTPPLETILELVRMMQSFAESQVVKGVGEGVADADRQDVARARRAAQQAERRRARRAAEEAAAAEAMPAAAGDAGRTDIPVRPGRTGMSDLHENGSGVVGAVPATQAVAPPTLESPAALAASTNGSNGAGRPSTNDANGAGHPSHKSATDGPTNGTNGAAPSTHGANGERRPTTNGPSGKVGAQRRPKAPPYRNAQGQFAKKPTGPAPSSHGANGEPTPSGGA